MKLSRILIIAVVLCISSFANAQTAKQAETDAREKTNQLTTALDLTENQEQLAFRKIYALELQTMKFNSVDEMTPEMEAIFGNYKENFNTEMKALLTDEQRVNFDNVWTKKINK